MISLSKFSMLQCKSSIPDKYEYVDRLKLMLSRSTAIRKLKDTEALIEEVQALEINENELYWTLTKKRGKPVSEYYKIVPGKYLIYLLYQCREGFDHRVYQAMRNNS